MRLLSNLSSKRWGRFAVMAVTGSVLFWTRPLWAEGGADAAASHGPGLTLLWLAVILLGAKVFSLVEKLGQPAVLGEILFGVLLGNLTLVGVSAFEPIRHDGFVQFLSQLGVILLLFQVGLETTVEDMQKVGWRAFLVATIGVIAPFTLGTFLVGPLVMPGMSFNAYLFLGATLTATSVGITARVFQDLGRLNTPEARIVLGAAVIDDVMGLIILAVVSLIVTTGAAGIGTISWITAKAFIFLAGSLVVGRFLAPLNNQLFSRIHTGIGMKLALALSTCLLMAYVASMIELAPIVGAFAAGLVLTPVHFHTFDQPKIVHEIEEVSKTFKPEDEARIKKVLDHHNDHHVAHLVEPIAQFLVPIFFVVTGFSVRLDTLFDAHALLVALGITAVAVVGKIVSGLAAGKVNKWIVGVGMIPRGEVGLIFAVMGKSLGVVTDEEFSVIVIMVMLTTLMTPPLLGMLLKRQKPVTAA
jgi:Kef-type K+ transport system membrane component KefB